MLDCGKVFSQEEENAVGAGYHSRRDANVVVVLLFEVCRVAEKMSEYDDGFAPAEPSLPPLGAGPLFEVVDAPATAPRVAARSVRFVAALPPAPYRGWSELYTDCVGGRSRPPQ